jgi:hypothetical protein
MPGSVGVVTGFVDREIGKSIYAASSLQRFGKGGGLMAGGGNIFVGVSAAGIGNGADTTEDTLFTVSLPPKSLDIVGRQILIEAYGSIAAAPSANKSAKIYFGSTVLANFAATTNQTGVWFLFATITKAAANVQSVVVSTDTTITASLVRSIAVPTAPTENDAAAIVIKVTGTSSVATANAVLCNNLTVSGYN